MSPEEKVSPYPYNIRDEMNIILYNAMERHPNKGDWRKNKWAGIGLMLNSAGNPNGDTALALVIEDTTTAYQLNVPIDLVRLAITQVTEWRTLLLKTQPQKEKTIGDLRPERLKEEMLKSLPADYVERIFS